MEQSVDKKKTLTGWHVLAGFIGFFLTIITANGIMTYYALGTWQGVETEDAYIKGLNYNQQLEQAQNQQSSQWKISLDQLPKIMSGDQISLSLIHPTYNTDVSKVSAEFIRPIEKGYDFEVELKAQDKHHYLSPVTFPLKGNWKIRVKVTFEDGAEMYLTDRMEIR